MTTMTTIAGATAAPTIAIKDAHDRTTRATRLSLASAVWWQPACWMRGRESHHLCRSPGSANSATSAGREQCVCGGSCSTRRIVSRVATSRRSRPVRVTPGALSQVGIAAFNPGALGTAGTSSPSVKPASPTRKTTPMRAVRATPAVADEPVESGQVGGAPGTAGGGGSGPVRLGSGEGLTLLTKVTPTYPHTMESARIPGTVVLDAIIRRDERSARSRSWSRQTPPSHKRPPKLSNAGDIRPSPTKASSPSPSTSRCLASPPFQPRPLSCVYQLGALGRHRPARATHSRLRRNSCIANSSRRRGFSR